jgi:hypothetical protein
MQTAVAYLPVGLMRVVAVVPRVVVVGLRAATRDRTLTMWMVLCARHGWRRGGMRGKH